MRNKWLCLLALGCMFITTGFIGCGDDDGGGEIDAGFDGGEEWDADLHDGDLPDADDPDSEVVGDPGCTGERPEEQQEVGGCCVDGSDCVKGECFGGYCSGQCTEDDDCSPTSVGPFPLGTEFSCNTNEMGFFSFCTPGSLQPCGGDGDSPCPAGEACVLGWDGTAENMDDPDQPGLRGVCLTEMYGDEMLDAGAVCDDNADPYFYQCKAPGYLFGSCMGRRCTTACDVNNPTETCPAGLECVGPLALDVGSSSLLLGTGMCAGQSCGHLQFSTNPEDDVRIPGVDSECPAGEVCTPYLITGAEGDVFTMRCIPDVPDYGEPGDNCEQSPKFEQFCRHDLCLQQAAEWTSDGAFCDNDEDCGPEEVCAVAPNQFVADRCAPKPDPGFCTMMCRSDQDCPDIDSQPNYCVNVGAGDLPNGESAYFTVCYPEGELFEETPATCEKETDCDNGLGEGCFRLSNYSDYRFCDQSVTADPQGTDCSTDPGVCGDGEACLEDFDTGDMTCTQVASIGDPCVPGEGECLSGYCFDGEFDIEDEQGDPTNTFCSGVCKTTYDCGENQVCTNILWAENDPETEDDDITGGLCLPMTVRIDTETCVDATDCDEAGKLCDTDTGRCYDPTAVWGGECDDDSDCNQNGLCNTDVTNGLCYKPGCDPNEQVDIYCGAGDVVCSDNSAVGVCLESCTVDGDCTRNATDGHICVNGACEAP